METFIVSIVFHFYFLTFCIYKKKINKKIIQINLFTSLIEDLIDETDENGLELCVACL